METKTKSKSIISIILSIAFVLALSVVTLFAGCGKGNKNDQTAAPEATAQSQAEVTSTTETTVTCVATFDAHGGVFEDGSKTQTVEQTVYNDQNFCFKDDVAELETPTREGYNFIGWGNRKTATRIETKFNVANTITEKTYYAVWANKNKCYCYFNINCNDGYFESKNGEPNEIVIPYIKDSDQIESDGAYHFLDSKKDLLKNYTPVREGYKFVGFASTEDSTTPVKYFRVHAGEKYKEDFFAIWQKVCTATFDANGGTFADGNATLSFSQTMETADQIADFSTEAKANMPTREGYTFLGWAKDGQNGKYTYKLAKNYKFGENDHNVTYHAIWALKQNMTANFNAAGGEFVDGKFVRFSKDAEDCGTFAGAVKVQTFTLNLDAATNGYYSFKKEAEQVSGNSAPTKDGYVFKGWAKSNGTIVKNFSIPANRGDATKGNYAYNYYAIWEKIA